MLVVFSFPSLPVALLSIQRLDNNGKTRKGTDVKDSNPAMCVRGIALARSLVQDIVRNERDP